MANSKLTTLQKDFLDAFFGREDQFFLTGGAAPAQLSWVLNQIELGDDLVPPGNVSTEDLRRYLADLIARLAHMAFPG